MVIRACLCLRLQRGAACGAGGVMAWEPGRREGGARARRALMSTTRSGLQSVVAAKADGEVPWTSEFCRAAKQAGLKNVYMELGSTFGQLATANPAACAHLLGQMIDAFGADHVLWGTDSIWYGTPQWQIEAFRRFEIPDALVEKHKYAPLARAVKEQVFGVNAARLFGVDVNAKRN